MKMERRDLPVCSRDAGWEKLKTLSAACEGPPAAERSVIDMTSSNRKRNEAARSEHVTLAMSRMACTIADRIAQRKGPFMPPVPKYVLRRPLRAKVGSPMEKPAIIKSNNMDYVVKVAPRPISSTIETDEICVLLKPDLLENMDACAKFVDGVRKVCLPKFLCEAYDTI